MNSQNKQSENQLIDVLDVITRWLELRKIPYMVFGGVANSLYGNPRQTFDIDIKISLEPSYTIEHFINDLRKISSIAPHDPLNFIKDTQVLPVDLNGVRIDIVFAGLSFEKRAIQRSRDVEFYGVRFKVCTVEDLIIHKVISTRQKDWLDIDSLVNEQRSHIDWEYLLKHCEELSRFMSRSEIITKIRQLKDEA